MYMHIVMSRVFIFKSRLMQIILGNYSLSYTFQLMLQTNHQGFLKIFFYSFMLCNPGCFGLVQGSRAPGIPGYLPQAGPLPGLCHDGSPEVRTMLRWVPLRWAQWVPCGGTHATMGPLRLAQ
jgi:hypothetical protein